MIYCFQTECFFLRKCWIYWICSNAFFRKMLLSAEMLNMLNMLNVFRTCRPLLNTPIPWGGPNIQHYSWKMHFFQKNAPFCGNVEYVEYVQTLLSAEMLNMMNVFFELTDPFWTPQVPERNPTFNITAERSIFTKNASFCGNVEYVEYVLGLVSRYVLLSTVSWICWICWMFFGTYPRNIQHYSCKKHSFWKCASFCCNAEYVKCKTFNIFNIFNISPERSTFFKTIPRTHSTFWALQQKGAHFQKQMLLAAVMLNVVVFFWGLRMRSVKFKKHSTYSTFSQKEARFSKPYQEHIQHIQHYSRKEHIFKKCFLQLLFFWGFRMGL